MNGRRLVIGIIATAIVIVLSLGFISLFSFPTLSGWVTYYLICTIPMQIIVSINWDGKLPELAVRQQQPMRGLLLTLVTVIAGIVISVIYLAAAGGNITPPTPMLAQCTIVSVVVTFWASIMWGGWPFRAWIRNPLAAGIVQLAACYVVNYALFRIFFNFDFMKDLPEAVRALDPHGMFNAWSALVFYVTALAVMFLTIHLDMWPVRKPPKQPFLGIGWTVAVLAITAAVFYIGVNVVKVDPVTFLVSVPIPFIFGTIVVRNMFEGILFSEHRQPVRGLLSAISAALIGTGLSWMYAALAGVVTGRLHSGPPEYDFEIWLASALLGVTFPFLIIGSAFFDFWPVKNTD